MATPARGLFNKGANDASKQSAADMDAKRKALKEQQAQKKAAKMTAGAAVNMGGTGAPTASATYVVLSKRSMGGAKPMFMIEAVPIETKGNGDPAYLSFGAMGSALFPSQRVDPGPEAKDTKEQATYKLALSPTPADYSNGYEASSFALPPAAEAQPVCAFSMGGKFVYTAFPENPRTDGKPTLDIASITPGTILSAGTLRGSFGKSGDASGKVYLNVHQVSVVGELCPPWQAAQKIMAVAKQPQVQAFSALALTMPCGGFYLPETSEPSQLEQADLFKADMDAVPAVVARELRAKAQLASVTGQQQAQLLKLAEEMDRHTGKDVAAGWQPLQVNLPKDCTTPYSAMLVCAPVPGTSIFVSDAIDGNETPARFVEAEVVKFTWPSQGLLQVAFALTFVANRDKMLDALFSGNDPFLPSPGDASLAVQFSLRREAFTMLGCDSKDRAVLLEEIVKGAPFALSVPVFPSQETNSKLFTPFVDSSGIDARNGIRGAGVPVTAEFVDTHLGGGRGFLAGKGGDDEVFEPMAGISKRNFPKYSKDKMGDGYQCVNWEQSLELAELEDGATFWVLFQGCAKGRADLNLENNKWASAEDGNAYLIKNLASISKTNTTSMKDFLARETLVYLVAPDPAP